jgi:hypothetical protein
MPLDGFDRTSSCSTDGHTNDLRYAHGKSYATSIRSHHARSEHGGDAETRQSTKIPGARFVQVLPAHGEDLQLAANFFPRAAPSGWLTVCAGDEARRLRTASLKIARPRSTTERGDPKLARGLHPVIATRRGRPMEHRITVFAGPASSQLGAAFCNALQVAPGLYECRRFPDGEAQIDIQESVRGRDVYLLQSTSPRVDQHVMELLRASVLDDAFDELTIGRPVAFVEERGEMGPQASTVRVLGKHHYGAP